MTNLLENIGIIINNIILWLGTIANALIRNEIFQIMLGVIILILLFDLIKSIINNIRARNLGIGLTGSTNELEYYRSLSEEEKEKYNNNNL